MEKKVEFPFGRNTTKDKKTQNVILLELKKDESIVL